MGRITLHTIRALFLVWLVFAAPAVRGDDKMAVTADGVTAPLYLYHWTSFKNLKRMAEGLGENDPFILPPMCSSSYFAANARTLSGTRAIFTWHHPVGAIGTYSGSPFYGDGQALVRFTLDPALTKAIRVHTRGTASDPLDLTGIDLVEHLCCTRGSFHDVTYMEWVLLNPAVIRSLTANPDVLRPILEPEIARLKDPDFFYSNDQIHWQTGEIFRSDGVRANIVRSLENAIKPEAASQVHPYFLRDESGKCLKSLSAVGGSVTGSLLGKIFRNFR